MTTPVRAQENLASFRKHIPDLTIPRFRRAQDQDAYSYAKEFQETRCPPWLYSLTEAWEILFEESYKGLTNDGNVVPNLFPLQDESVQTSTIVEAAESLIEMLTSDQKSRLLFPVGSSAWRAWSNPEFLLRPWGLRLEEQSPEIVIGILRILEHALSPEGYQKALSAMRMNHFLGEIVGLPRILNQYSYNFLFFGTASLTESFGFLLYGHHLCIAVFVRGPQIVIAPTFTGAEPNVIDAGTWSGTEILHRESQLGLRLMQSLAPQEQKTAQIYKELKDPLMTQTGNLLTDRWNQDDQRHLCGAFRDNRVVPYEGVRVASMTDAQQHLIFEIAEEYLLYHPAPSRNLKMELIKKHLNETWFSWIGGFGDKDAYYYRVQGPIVIMEFDHHSGVFLGNSEPAKFHTHTILRFANAGDYGNALRDEQDKL